MVGSCGPGLFAPASHGRHFMKNIGLALLLLLLSAPASAQQTAPELQFESVPDFLKLPAGMNFGEVPGRRGELARPHLRLHALEQRERTGLCADRGTAARVRSERRIHRRGRQRIVRLGVRAQRPHRSRRQHLGHRQGLGHDHQVQSARPRRLGLRPPAGIGGRGCGPSRACRSAARPCRWSVPSADRCRVGLRGQHLYQRRLHQLARRQISIATAIG